MNKIIMKRQSGKTTNIIKRSAETGYQIVVSNLVESNRIITEAVRMGIEIPTPVPVGEIIHDNRGRRYDKFIVDNIDDVFDAVCKMQFPGFKGIDTLTMTYDKEPLFKRIKKKLKGVYYGFRY